MERRSLKLTPEQWEALRKITAAILRQGYGSILVSSSDAPPGCCKPPACFHIAEGGREIYTVPATEAGPMLASLFEEHGVALSAKQKTEAGRLSISEHNRRRAAARRKANLENR